MKKGAVHTKDVRFMVDGRDVTDQVEGFTVTCPPRQVGVNARGYAIYMPGLITYTIVTRKGKGQIA